jgi:copper chaperone CopZ
MKTLILFLTVSILVFSQLAFARTVEVEVHGMTCELCVDTLERSLGKMATVSNVQVSLELKKIRLETDKNQPSIESIEQTVLDAGFTPVKITVLTSTINR